MKFHPSELSALTMAENLDGFADSADLNAHIAELVDLHPSDSATYLSPIPVAYLAYAKHRARAMDCRLMGLMEEALVNERACEREYARIPSVWQW